MIDELKWEEMIQFLYDKRYTPHMSLLWVEVC